MRHVSCTWKVFNEACLIIGKVNHSYAMSSTPLNPWIIVKNSGTVVSGHCTCMAGLGEACSHIGALLYWIEYTVRKRDEESCTSKANKWTSKYKKLLISKRRIGILKKLPKQGEDSESL